MATSFDTEFDKITDRSQQPGDKWGRYADKDIIPMWIADTDFEVPDVILQRLRERIDHRIFGYATEPWPALSQAAIDHIWQQYHWKVEADWFVWLHGLVTGINLSCLMHTAPHHKVFTATPIYPPFLAAPDNQHCPMTTAPLKLSDGQWQWDKAATEAAIDEHTKTFLLCNPHNPVGRAYTEAELRWIADLAEQRDMIVCSDEIHCDLVLNETQRHLPIASLSPEIEQRSITLMAPSKTWNIASLYCGFAIIPNPELRQRYLRAKQGLCASPNIMGMVAGQAAWEEGEPWRQSLLAYLRRNRDTVTQAINAMPGLSTVSPEATFLSWIDCRDTGIEDPVGFFEKAGVGLMDGKLFGAPGFVRLNFGCTHALLEKALTRMQNALNTRG